MNSVNESIKTMLQNKLEIIYRYKELKNKKINWNKPQQYDQVYLLLIIEEQSIIKGIQFYLSFLTTFFEVSKMRMCLINWFALSRTRMTLMFTNFFTRKNPTMRDLRTGQYPLSIARLILKMWFGK